MPLLSVLNLLKKNKPESGFNLIEMLVVTAIIGIMSAVAVPNLLGEQRDNQAKEAFTKIRGALIEAQTNANRTSSNCTVTITTSSISGSSSGCVLETTNFDSSVVSVTSSAGNLPQSITFDFEGDTAQAQTIQVAPKNSSNPILEKSRCIVISPNLGMIRTGFYDASASANCNNTENERYDNQ